MVNPIWKQIIAHPDIQSNYFASNNPLHDNHGLKILSKIPCIFTFTPLKSKFEGRGMLTCYLGLKTPLVVSTTHLDPWLDQRELRLEQLHLEQTALKSLGKSCLLAGDLNLHGSETDAFDRENFVELWEALRAPDEEKYTWLGPDDGDPIYSKLDFCLLSKDKNYNPVFITRCGNYSIPSFAHESHHKVNEDGVLRSPSDHLALYMVIK